MDLDFEDNIDISSALDELEIAPPKKVKNTPKKRKSAYKTEYDHQTEEYYKSCRLQKLDPILLIKVDEDKAFKFKNMWDPYTGETLGKDPNGPLYFHPDSLIRHLYNQRVNKLWIYPEDSNDGYYQGSYDDGVGIGKKFYFNSMYNPQWYVFRLPIYDCYLTKDHKMQHLTLGPELTNKHIAQLEKLASKYYKNDYYNFFHKRRPSIVLIKQLYDKAIAQEVDDINVNIKTEEKKSLINKINRDAVDKLLKIKG